jgi:PTH2 family peptidyl-tRNA hydrolase
MYNFKQVLVTRADLKMRRGKEIAQTGHACTSVVVNIFARNNKKEMEVFHTWQTTGMAKIGLRVDTEQELLDVFNAACQLGIPVEMITDSGHTEFHGIPTRTCLAIGPWDASVIDTITGHLKLY